MTISKKEPITMSKNNSETMALAANTIRCLSADAIQAAKSGHPGLPMGMADVATVLWLKYLKHDPLNPAWPDRDRFVLSGGHGSMLLYSLLHLAGYGLTIDDLKGFRQLGSLTPGHPEFGHTKGVETSTGPLGQGIANAVGMALAERMLADRLGTPDEAFTPIDHRTIAFCGDGDLEEGISHEACSLAGHLKLDRLLLIYDSNSITIEGSTSLACSDDVAMRFKAYGWRVLETDGHDFDAIDKALRKAFKLSGKPTILIAKTTIGKGSPNMQGTSAVHGAPLGEEELRLTKQNLGFDPDKSFYVPEEVYALYQERTRSLHRKSLKWGREFKAWRKGHPELAVAWDRHFSGEVPENIETVLPKFDPAKPISTRSASGKVINALAPAMPQFVGGSADLAPSNNTDVKGAPDLSAENYSGRNFHFGIRELGMSAIMNGIAAHGGFKIYGGTFFVFSDYCRPALRVAALMKLPIVFVFTHDSFYVGEDGPTHQPVEQIAALRAIPNVLTLRPADATETAAAWVTALRNNNGPTAILLTRQNLDVIDRNVYPKANLLEKGAYTLWQTGEGTPDLTIIATGSEVAIALEAAKQINDAAVRVVSMPSVELFEKQTAEYQDSVIDPACTKRLVVEAGVSLGWHKYAGNDGAIISLDRFGASGTYKDLAKLFGFTAENVLAKARELLAK